MDLTIPLEKITLNIRVAALIKMDNGYVLEKSKGGYYFPVGGRVKAGETSEEAVKREILEELGVEVNNVTLQAVVELFFGEEGKRVQEICFVYSVQGVDTLKLADEFCVYTVDQIEAIDFRPRIIKEVIKSNSASILHLIEKE